MWYVYIIDKANILYTGITHNLTQRLQEHGRESGGTVHLLYKEEIADKIQAAKRERQIKGWTRRKKLALIDGDFKLLRDL